MKLIRVTPVVLTLLLPAMPAAALVSVPEVTGTWEGKFVCNYVSDDPDFPKGKYTDSNVTLLISRSGNLVNAYWEDTFSSYGYMRGYIIPDFKISTKGQMALADCYTTNDPYFDYGELANLSVSADPTKVKGSVKGLSIYSIPNSNGLEVGQCKWQFKLISTADPGIAACPP